MPTDPLPILDLRHVATFVVVAEELHFGNAASRLHLAQPAVSAHVRKLEDDVGAQLLLRTSRRVELTDAGAAFLVHARRLQQDARAAIVEARRIDRGESGSLTVGLAQGSLLPPLREAFAAFTAARPDVTLTLRESSFGDPSGGLDTGEADVAIVCPPLGTPDILTQVLAEEPRVAVLPEAHPLAARDEVAIEDLLDEPWTYAATDPVWRAFWTAEAERGGPARYGATVESMEGIFKAVQTGVAVALVPASVERAMDWEGVVFRSVRGTEPNRIAVAWRPGADDPLVRAFVAEVKRAVLGRA